MRSLSEKITITPNMHRKLSLKEIWLYRELLFFFAWRDIKVRYKQTVLGAGWAVLQPLLAAAIFTLFFNRVAKISAGAANIPYPVFAYLGLMYWNAFASSLNTVSNSLLSNSGVLSKIYFPRLLPPLAATALSIVDFIFAGIIFIILLFIYKINPGVPGILLVIPSLLLIMVSSFGIGTFFAALNAKYRDIRSALPFIIQITFFMTPVIYPITLIPQRFQIYAYLNPATGAISSIKAGLFGETINWAGLSLSWASALLLLIIGVWYFKHMERNFVDYL